MLQRWHDSVWAQSDTTRENNALLVLNTHSNLNCLHLLKLFMMVQHHHSAQIRVLCNICAI